MIGEVIFISDYVLFKLLVFLMLSPVSTILRDLGKYGVLLGDVMSSGENPASLASPSFNVPLEDVTGKDVTLEISVVPFWPLYPGMGNSFGVSIDGCPPVVCENIFAEFSEEWKNQVLVNSKTFEVTLPLDNNLDSHYLTIIKGDPGQMIQKIKIMD